MRIITLKGHQRHDVIKIISESKEMVGVELGVAGGGFSKRMVESGAFEHFFGVDMYADHHDTKEYKQALRSVGMFANYKLLRMTFDEALELFPDQSLDFVYVDGYAATGEEGGQTIFRWYNKVKVGGVLAGDDYHERWPLVMKVVNNFSKAADLDLFVTEVTEAKEWCQYPSWAVVKKVHQSIETPEALLKEGKIGAVGMQTYMKNKHDKRERHRIKWQFINGYLKPMLPNWIISFAKLLHKPWKKKEDCLCD